MGASGKKGMVHSGRERHAAQGKENGSGKGVHATTWKPVSWRITASSIQDKNKTKTKIQTRAPPPYFRGKEYNFPTYTEK